MKVTFVSTNDFLGGAARATYWLAKGLRSIDIEIKMIVDNKFKADAWIEQVGESWLYRTFRNTRRSIDSLPLRLYPKRTKQAWSVNRISNPELLKRILSEDSDIVNLHWVGSAFFPLRYLKLLKRPIVWSLYDMWAFTGGCHYDDGCGGYIRKCGACPQLGSSRSKLSEITLSTKVRDLSELDITVVAPSSWLAERARESTLLKAKNICVIPHGTDLTIFKPVDKRTARAILNLELERTYILFASTGGVSDERKGYQYLSQAIDSAIRKIGNKDVTVLILGDTQLPSYMPNQHSCILLGRAFDDIFLSIIYSAADLVLTPSRQEAFGMTASEAMACGTPVIGFGVSGVLEVIEHKSTGYLAKPFSIDDFAEGIAWCLSNNVEGDLSKNCIGRVRKYFDLKSISTQYARLYKRLR